LKTRRDRRAWGMERLSGMFEPFSKAAGAPMLRVCPPAHR